MHDAADDPSSTLVVCQAYNNLSFSFLRGTTQDCVSSGLSDS